MLMNTTIAAQTLIELGGVPIDRVAWRVIGPGEHYERPAKLRQLCFDNAPPIVSVERNHNDAKEERTKTLFGIRFGRLTVIGYWGRRAQHGKRNGRRGLVDQLWVCRCLCGLFTIRTAKVICTERPPEHTFPPMCDACAVDHIRKLGFPLSIAFGFVSHRGTLPHHCRVEIMDRLGIGPVGKHCGEGAR